MNNKLVNYRFANFQVPAKESNITVKKKCDLEIVTECLVDSCIYFKAMINDESSSLNSVLMQPRTSCLNLKFG